MDMLNSAQVVIVFYVDGINSKLLYASTAQIDYGRS